jgi:hypothetical protein
VIVKKCDICEAELQDCRTYSTVYSYDSARSEHCHYCMRCSLLMVQFILNELKKLETIDTMFVEKFVCSLKSAREKKAGTGEYQDFYKILNEITASVRALNSGKASN